MMVGREISFVVPKADATPKQVVLSVSHLFVKDAITKKEMVKDTSFSVKAGEIVCIAGIEGNGQSELINAITGLEPIKNGKVFLNGVDITDESIHEKIKNGMSHIPEDRQKYGLVLDYNVEQNMVIEQYRDKKFATAGWINFAERKRYSDALIRKYDVRSSRGSETMTRSMSGGNQQKIIVGRELDKAHSLLICVQPTRGLDVGAVEDIHKKIIADRDAGKAVLLVSLELEEVMNLSDRILVMYNGELVGSFNPKEVTAPELGLYMAGARKMRLDENGNPIVKLVPPKVLKVVRGGTENGQN
jgi:simple sugar transport system ATP-binding protein